MTELEYYFMILLAIQFFHSIEELTNGFHEKFPLGKMKFRTFLIFEILFLGFWVGVLFFKEFQYRDQLMAVFNILMFANGLWHMVWWVFVDTRCCSGIAKKYVPGLVTAPLFVVTLKMQFIPELMRIPDDF